MNEEDLPLPVMDSVERTFEVSESCAATEKRLPVFDENVGDDYEVENWDWDFVFPEPKERWTQEVTLIYRGREKPGQMVFPDEVFLEEE